MLCAHHRYPAQDECGTKDNRSLDQREQRPTKQRILQPNDKIVMHQIKAVGVDRKTIEDRRPLRQEAQACGNEKKQPPAQARTNIRSAAISTEVGASPFRVR